MTQWKLNSLILLCTSFLAFLLFFNICSFLLGSTTELIPFVPTSNGYELTITNLSIHKLPISIESFPLSSYSPTFTIKCGDEIEISEQKFSLSTEYFLSVFSLCDITTIKVQPNIPELGLWFRFHNPVKTYFNLIIHFFFLFIIGISLYLLFKNGKNNSVMRSTLITQTSILLILDPLKYLISFFPQSFHVLHTIVSSIGWWRCTTEIFAEYGPLIRQKYQFYRTFSAIPTVILILTTISGKISRYYFPFLSTISGIFGGFLLPFASTFFLSKAKNINGRNALFVHVIGGSIAMTVAYFMKVLRVINEDFKDSFLCESVETTFVGCYALFQAIFQAGEGSTQNQPFYPLKNQDLKILPIDDEKLVSGISTIDGMLDQFPDVGGANGDALFGDE